MKFKFSLTAMIALALAPLISHADNYPSKPITLIVPYQAGGSIDGVMRALTNSASKKLGQPFVIDNKAGGSGTVGPAAMAATAKPDGYTLSVVGITMFRLPLLQKVSFDPEKDFTYISRVAGITFGMTTGAQTPFKTWADVVDFAKKNPNKLTYGSPGQNSTPHLGMEQIAAAAGIQLTHIPYKSSPDTNAALLGGHIDLQVDGAGWKPLVDSGKARLLGVWTSSRTKRWPDVPTLKELGYPLVFESPLGIGAPKGLDPKIAAKLQDAFRSALEDPEVQKVYASFEFIPSFEPGNEYYKALLQMRDEEKAAFTKMGLLK